MEANFGEYIRKLRNQNNLTLTQLGAKLDLDSGALSKIETGKKEFDEKCLNKLAKVFDLDIEKLKTEYFGDQFAKKMYQYNCSPETLIVAEKKVNYLKNINVKQGEIEFDNEK
jgi:HTH-type transcriptional regulator, competence development regulator